MKGGFNDVHIDPSQYGNMDVGAKSNANIKDKKIAMFKNEVRRVGNFFSFVNEAKISSIAELAVERGFQTQAFMSAMERIVNMEEKFPSFKTVSDLVRVYTEVQAEDTSVWDQQKKAEDDEYMAIRDEFIKVLGEEKLRPFVQWWIKAVYPELSKELLSVNGLGLDLFERCALFDWKDTGPTQNYKRVIDTANRKMEILNKYKLQGKKPFGRLK